MNDLTSAASALLEKLKSAGLTVAAAESCTGGLIAASLTEIAGSSVAFDRAFITYSNNAKAQMLDVPIELIKSQGAVSQEVAIEMAKGALGHSSADIAVSVTGIAGPGGATPNKPVGTVHFACVKRGAEPVHSHQVFADMDRAQVRHASVLHAFALIEQQINAQH